MSVERKISAKAKAFLFESLDTVIVLATMLCILLALLSFLIRPTIVRGNSMDPTLEDNQFLLAYPVYLCEGGIQHGDIVIAKLSPVKSLVKRAVALPGDTLEIKNNRVILNGEVLEEPYLKESMICRDVPPMTLGEGEYYLLGDNRNISADSRIYGTFDVKNIKAVATNTESVWGILSFGVLVALIIAFTCCADHIVSEFGFYSRYVAKHGAECGG